ncbi:MAG: hypothetical protein AAGG02_21500 [Cyanobacteria bacterium P01_H01_bin.15]
MWESLESHRLGVHFFGSAAKLVGQLEHLGAAGVILEDQKHPRRCGQVDGQQLLGTDSYWEKLTNVLADRDRLFVSLPKPLLGISL